MLHTTDHVVENVLRASGEAPSHAGAIEQIARVGRARLLTAGTTVHRAGELFRSVFLLRSGATKRLLI